MQCARACWAEPTEATPRERCWAEPTEATPPGTHRAGWPCAADPQPERRGLDKHRRGDLATQAGGMRSGGRLRCKVSFGDDVVRGSARGWPRGRLPHGARGLAGVVGGGDGGLIFASSRSELHSASHPVCCTLIRVAIYFYSLLLILPSCHCSSSMGCRCRYCVGFGGGSGGLMRGGNGPGTRLPLSVLHLKGCKGQECDLQEV